MNFLLSGNALFGLLAAAAWGIGDFSGGMGVKSAGLSPEDSRGSKGISAALRIVLASHSASFVVLLTAIWLAAVWRHGEPFPHGMALLCGLAAGVAGGTSLTCFYMALSRGAMGASAAVSGLLAAAIPAVVGMYTDGAPGLRRGVGFLLAGVAIWAIAGGSAADANPDTGADRVSSSHGTLGLAVAAGVGFGIYFVLLKVAGAAGVLWPMATARMGSLTTCGLVLLWVIWRRGGEAARVPLNRKMALWALGTATFDTSGNMLFIAATRSGRLDVAAVLASLYPASTIVLAAWMLRERPSLRQGLGMLLAAGAVVLITI